MKSGEGMNEEVIITPPFALHTQILADLVSHYCTNSSVSLGPQDVINLMLTIKNAYVLGYEQGMQDVDVDEKIREREVIQSMYESMGAQPRKRDDG